MAAAPQRGVRRALEGRAHPVVLRVGGERLLGLRQLAQLHAALRQQVPAVRVPRAICCTQEAAEGRR
jgi:hypothetical protein